MNPKTTIVLIAALVVAVFGVWWAQSSSNEPKPTEEAGPSALYENLNTSDIKQFEIKAGSAATCSFEMVDDKWRMTAPIAGPSQHYTVNGDVTRLVNLKYVRSYSESDPERPTSDMTSLDNPPMVAKLTAADGESRVLRIGAQQILSNKTYVQKDNDETIYLVDADLNRDLKRDLADYRGKRVAEFSTSEAVRIEVTGEQSFVLSKKNNKWTIESPVKARADAAPVNALLSAVSSLNVERFVEDAPKSLRPFGLDNPRLVVAITTEKKTPKEPKPDETEGPTTEPAEPEYEIDTNTIRVAFGGVADDKVFAKLDDADAPAVFQVNEDVVKRAGPKLDDIRDKKVVDIETNKAQRIRLSAGDDSIELAKSGADWRIMTPMPGAPSDIAEFAAVDDLLKALRELKATGFEEMELAGHGFDAPQSVIELEVEGQVEPARIAVGALAPSKTSVYVRNEREDFVAAVPADKVNALTDKPISFLSREILKFPLAQASKIEIARPNRAYTVERADDGGWQFTAPITGPAELTAITNIVRDLSDLRGRRVVARAQKAGDYGLTQPPVRVTVTVQAQPSPPPATQPADVPKEPSATYTLSVARQSGIVHAMRDGGPLIYEIDGKVLDDLEAELFNTKVMAVEPYQVRRIAYAGEESFSFEKNGDDWTLAGEASFQVDSAKLTQFLDALRDLKLSHYVAYTGADLPTYGLDNAGITIDVTGEDGAKASLMISSRGPGSDRYAHTGDALDRVFVIKGADIVKLRKKIKDFQKAS